MTVRQRPRSCRGAALLLSALLGAAACGDDAVTPPPADTETSTSDGTVTGPSATTSSTSGADTTAASASGTGSATGTSTGDTEGTTTGGEALPGQTMSQLVSSGTRASSRSFTLVHTLGQPSSLQSTHVSRGYTLHGGLAGANGSPP